MTTPQEEDQHTPQEEEIQYEWQCLYKHPVQLRLRDEWSTMSEEEREKSIGDFVDKTEELTLKRIAEVLTTRENIEATYDDKERVCKIGEKLSITIFSNQEYRYLITAKGVKGGVKCENYNSLLRNIKALQN